jgi:hypothetical protein
VQLAVLIGSTAELVDAAETLDTLKQREKQWRDSLAGRQWRIETGRAKDPATGAANPGLPFYAGVRAPWPPSPADTIRPIDRRLKALWQTGSGDRSALRPKFDREMAGAEWGDLEVVRQFPRLRGAKLQGPLPVMKLLAPHITLLFRTVRELGWNDLLFQTMGAYAFRQSTGTAGVPSNHATGLAIDINSFENPQVGRPPKGATVWAPGWSALDPRIVAIFEFFGFRWGRSIRQDSQPLAGSDPMHFELWVGTASPPTC